MHASLHALTKCTLLLLIISKKMWQVGIRHAECPVQCVPSGEVSGGCECACACVCTNVNVNKERARASNATANGRNEKRTKSRKRKEGSQITTILS